MPVVDVQPLPARDGKTAGVESELLHERGMNVCDVVSIDMSTAAQFWECFAFKLLCWSQAPAQPLLP
jgi:hypothetical protein